MDGLYVNSGCVGEGHISGLYSGRTGGLYYIYRSGESDRETLTEDYIMSLPKPKLSSGHNLSDLASNLTRIADERRALAQEERKVRELLVREMIRAEMYDCFSINWNRLRRNYGVHK